MTSRKAAGKSKAKKAVKVSKEKKPSRKIVKTDKGKASSKTPKKSTKVRQRTKASLKTKSPEKKPVSSMPDSMEDLIKQTGYNLQTFKKGDLVKATLTDKGKRAVFFDISAKTEGIVASRELEIVKDYLKQLNIGDMVEVRIVTPENEKGQILLSLKEAANNWKWNLLDQYFKSGEAVEVRGLDVNRGGMIARIIGIRGFIPTSQFGRSWTGKLEQLYNKLFPVKIIEIDREKNRLIFSERAISEEVVLKQQEEAAKKVKPGQEYQGEISGIMPFGLFVKISVKTKAGRKSKKEDEEAKEATVCLDGLVHISQVSWGKIDDLQKLFKQGEKVKVKVIDVDSKTSKLNLSIKQLQSDPWEDIAKKYKKDKKFKGKVTRLAAFGVFVELEPGVEGLIHISKIPAEKEMKVDDQIQVYIESLDLEQRRISLGLILSAKPVGYK